MTVHLDYSAAGCGPRRFVRKEVRYKTGGRGRTPPLRRVTSSAEEESPRHGFAVPAPFRQGGLGTEEADCHNQ